MPVRTGSNQYEPARGSVQPERRLFMMKRLLPVLLLTLAGYSQVDFNTRSAATQNDPMAILTNPAGLAFMEQDEILIYGHSSTRDLALMTKTGAGGFRYFWDDVRGMNIWTFSSGAKIDAANAIGMSYTIENAPWREGKLDVGYMFRPKNSLSLGLNVRNAWSHTGDMRQVQLGAGTQNQSGRFGLAADVVLDLDDTGPELEVDTQPFLSAWAELVPGIRTQIYAELGGDDPALGVSFGLALPDVSFETHGKIDQLEDQTIGVRVSERSYRSIFGKMTGKAGTQTFVRINLRGRFIEEPVKRSPDFPINFDIPLINTDRTPVHQLREFIETMDGYTADESIDGLIIDLGSVSGGYAIISDMRAALQRFRAAGKDIIVYAKYGMSNATIYLTAPATEIYLHEQASVGLQGLAMEITFLRGLLDTLSIVPETWRISPYKTAGDTYLNKRMSPEMRENYTSLLGSIYEDFVAGIALGKDWSDEKTREVIDNGPYLVVDEAVEAGLVTGTFYPDEFEKYIKGLNDEKVKIIKGNELSETEQYCYSWREGGTADQIAVIYAVGAIMPGKSKSGRSGSTVMGNETIAREIRRAREDKNIKAIILRIDSGGGSALASDLIWREVYRTTVEDTLNRKPFIASLSNVAASGGYYIACQADSIIAYPATITGSIGVIGQRLNFTNLRERFGIHTDRIEMGANATFLSGSHLATENEEQVIRASIQDTYMKFKERVIKGRESLDDIEALDSLALGRVWTGEQAVSNGLTDKVGGYYDAIQLAREAAGLEDEVEIVEYPRHDAMETISQMMKRSLVRQNLPEEVLEVLEMEQLMHLLDDDPVQAVLPIMVEIK